MHYTCDLDHIALNLPIGNCFDVYTLIEKDLHSLAPYLDRKETNLAHQLLQNEQTHSFSAGNGVIVANTTIKDLSRPYHIFYRTQQPFKFNTVDDKHVDLILVLLSPETDGPLHLRRLSRLTRLMQDDIFVQHLREMNDEESIRGQFMYPEQSTRAA